MHFAENLEFMINSKLTNFNCLWIDVMYQKYSNNQIEEILIFQIKRNNRLKQLIYNKKMRIFKLPHFKLKMI